jgi:predicted HNH restriction endonuclease
MNIIDEHPVLATYLRQRGFIQVHFVKPVIEDLKEGDEETRKSLRDLGYLN